MNLMIVNLKKILKRPQQFVALLTLSFSLFTFYLSPCFALTSDQLNDVQAQRRSESIITEAYLDSARAEPILLVGGQFDRFLNEHFYIGGVIVGAISGGVGGYGLGALTLGNRWPLNPSLAIDTRLNVGGAGGGGVRAGGGLLVEPLIGITWQYQTSIWLKVETGFIRFLTSGYQPWVLSSGVDFGFEHLFIPILK